MLNASSRRAVRIHHPCDIAARFVEVELYFDDLDQAKRFDADHGSESPEREGHFTKFDGWDSFVCLKGRAQNRIPRTIRSFFFEVPDLQAAIGTIGPDCPSRIRMDLVDLSNLELGDVEPFHIGGFRGLVMRMRSRR